MNIPDFDLQLSSVEHARSIYGHLAEDGQYLQSAFVAQKSGEKFSSKDSLLDACRYFIYAKQPALCGSALAKLREMGLEADETVLKITALMLIFVNQEAAARELLSRFSDLRPESSWINHLRAGKNALLNQLILDSHHRAQIQEGCSFSRENRLVVLSKVKCLGCEHIFPVKFFHTVHQVNFFPCERCFTPAVITPVEVLEALKVHDHAQKAVDGIGIDLQLWSWVHSWWREAECPAEATTEWGDNIFQALYFPLRCTLGEVYSRISARELIKEDASQSS